MVVRVGSLASQLTILLDCGRLDRSAIDDENGAIFDRQPSGALPGLEYSVDAVASASRHKSEIRLRNHRPNGRDLAAAVNGLGPEPVGEPQKCLRHAPLQCLDAHHAGQFDVRPVTLRDQQGDALLQVWETLAQGAELPGRDATDHGIPDPHGHVAMDTAVEDAELPEAVPRRKDGIEDRRTVIHDIGQAYVSGNDKIQLLGLIFLKINHFVVGVGAAREGC